jgi:hypothetical protein
MGVSIGHLEDMIPADKTMRMNDQWRPKGSTNVATPPNTNSLAMGPEDHLYQARHRRNIGHFIWDDLLSLFFSAPGPGWRRQDEGATHIVVSTPKS